MAKSLRGKCLVAAAHLRDPNFYKTVVLLVEHGEHGAMGLVINRPSSILVRNALAGHFDLPDSDELVFCGGPVEPAALLILHDADDLASDERAIVPGVFICSTADTFAEVIQRASCPEADLNYRIFSGCAGWAPGQLEGELSRGDWHVGDGCRNVVFHDDPYAIFDDVRQQIFAAHRLLPHTTPNPQWN
jgi:putative transcriptional regulator